MGEEDAPNPFASSLLPTRGWRGIQGLELASDALVFGVEFCGTLPMEPCFYGVTEGVCSVAGVVVNDCEIFVHEFCRASGPYLSQPCLFEFQGPDQVVHGLSLIHI